MFGMECIFGPDWTVDEIRHWILDTIEFFEFLIENPIIDLLDAQINQHENILGNRWLERGTVATIVEEADKTHPQPQDDPWSQVYDFLELLRSAGLNDEADGFIARDNFEQLALQLQVTTPNRCLHCKQPTVWLVTDFIHNPRLWMDRIVQAAEQQEDVVEDSVETMLETSAQRRDVRFLGSRRE
jgi:hypothetical protein